MKPGVLWIEDGAKARLADFVAAINVKGAYDLGITLNASDGINRILEHPFEAIVVDIRIPPGKNSDWEDLYSEEGSEKVAARLGLHLLYSLLDPTKARVKIPKIPPWVTANRFGILTVESKKELEDDLKYLNIKVFRQKKAELDQNALLEVIEEILKNRGIDLKEEC
ncbi:hypothetical protein CEE37_05695 [candidate division LCP-89 bacterium B3_LCP]|uniref:Response regulatory domain-containing protein n=1 Tax=candidate division LCP-89 bacterium B3_LCP TaxID=2012998 RepID=A0A532V1R7_UNCL8|nr:MAG: hypothetical protein CEE37_05695 [candidate division LCP-89 bacterium B3_LCP]